MRTSISTQSPVQRTRWKRLWAFRPGSTGAKEVETFDQETSESYHLRGRPRGRTVIATIRQRTVSPAMTTTGLRSRSQLYNTHSAAPAYECSALTPVGTGVGRGIPQRAAAGAGPAAGVLSGGGSVALVDLDVQASASYIVKPSQRGRGSRVLPKRLSRQEWCTGE